MIKVMISNNVQRTQGGVICDENSTLRSVIESNGFDASRTYTLDGSTLSAECLDKTFRELGKTAETLGASLCYLAAVAKQDSAC